MALGLQPPNLGFLLRGVLAVALGVQPEEQVWEHTDARQPRGALEHVLHEASRPGPKSCLCHLMCVSLDNMLDCSVPQFPHLQNGE